MQVATVVTTEGDIAEEKVPPTAPGHAQVLSAAQQGDLLFLAKKKGFQAGRYVAERTP